MMKRKWSNLSALAALFAVMLWCTFAQAGYIDNGDGTVTDNGTGLMWQKARAPGMYRWVNALSYCENLILNNDQQWTNSTANASGAKYSDWRLPTAKELASIVDTTQYSPAINLTYFPGTTTSFWTSTTDPGNPDTSAVYVDFSDGGIVFIGYFKTNSLYVRAVRSGQCGSFNNLTLWPVPDTGQTTCYNNTLDITCPLPGQAFYGQDASYSINTPSYTKLDAGCTALPANATTWSMVRDEVTGLIWEEKHAMGDGVNYADPNDADNIYTWYDGATGTPGPGTDTIDFINAMNTANYGGFSDWRMPTVKELQTILDYGRYYPSINTTYFPNTVESSYWSSTPLAGDSASAWRVYFDQSYVMYDYKSYSGSVRAVRSGQCGALSNLFISKLGTGAGTVTSGDSNINCGSDCSEAYARCTQVTLTATASRGYEFEGWSGGGCSGTGQCVVTVSDNVTVNAVFNPCPAPDLTAPEGATTPKPLFSWTKVNDVAWYNVLVWSEARGGIVASPWFGPASCTGSTCTAADLGTALPAGKNWWWLNVWYGDNSCGYIEQPGGKWKLIEVVACAPPSLTSPNSGSVAHGAKPTFIFQKTEAEWINIQAWSSTGSLSLNVWLDAVDICPGADCEWLSTKAFQPSTTNWWWLNTYSSACGYKMQPGGFVNSFYQN
jgi:hypothetical protein